MKVNINKKTMSGVGDSRYGGTELFICFFVFSNWAKTFSSVIFLTLPIRVYHRVEQFFCIFFLLLPLPLTHFTVESCSIWFLQANS